MGGWGPWSSLLRSLTLPQTAGSGQTRIVIGPDLPPPLDTYLFHNSYLATAAIIYYSAALGDNTYQFDAIVEGGGQLFLIRGAVAAGVVVEGNANRAFPSGLEIRQALGSQDHIIKLSSEIIYITSPLTQFNDAATSHPVAYIERDISLYGGMVANEPGADVQEDWHSAAILAAGWTGTLQYKLNAAPNNTVYVRGFLNPNAGSKADGTVIANLPASYRPTVLGAPIYCSAFGGVLSTAQPPHLTADVAAGNLSLYGFGTSTALEVNGMFPID